MALSNLEVHWLVKEFQPLVGLFYDKISDLDSGWKIKFRSKEIVVEVPERIYFTQHKQEARAPHGFTQYCRKHLRGKIRGIYQPNFDRIVIFEFDSGQKLVFELFSKGNVVLVGADGKIEKSFHDEEWSARTIKRGDEYKLPPSNKLDPREMTKKEFDSLFGEKDIIRSMVSGINMSGKYLELACLDAGVDKNSMEPGKKLFDVIKSYLDDYEPGIDEVPVVRKFSDAFIAKENFSEALDDYYSEIAPVTTKSEKVMRKIAQQEESIKELGKKSAEFKEKGDAIYANWQQLDELMKNIKQWREQGLSYDEINKKLGKKGVINKKTQKLTVNV